MTTCRGGTTAINHVIILLVPVQFLTFEIWFIIIIITTTTIIIIIVIIIIISVFDLPPFFPGVSSPKSAMNPTTSRFRLLGFP
jgi:hypothetical protein